MQIMRLSITAWVIKIQNNIIQKLFRWLFLKQKEKLFNIIKVKKKRQVLNLRQQKKKTLYRIYIMIIFINI